jgi:hypothetical protein
MLHSELDYIQGDLRQAARLLFDARVSRLNEDEALDLINRWQTYRMWCSRSFHITLLTPYIVPCLQPDAERESIRSALALFLCGYTAAEKFSLLSSR